MEFLDQPTPQADGAERALLGGLLLDGSLLATVAGDLEHSHFHRSYHRALWRFLLAMSASGEAIDLVTVTARLLAAGAADGVGGISYVAELPEHCPSTTNLAHYAGEIREAAGRRELVRIGVELANAAFAGRMPADEVASEAVRALCDLESTRRGGEGRWYHEVVPEVLDHAEAVSSGAAPPPLPTGYDNRWGLDDLTNGGLHQGQLIVMAAATGMGKTGLALSIACEVASRSRDVAYFSGELGQRELVTRALGYCARVSSRRIAVGCLSELDREQLDAHHPEQTRLWVLHRPRLTVARIATEARRLWSRGRLSLIVVDYLQLLRLDLDHRADTRPAALGRACVELRELGAELGVPVIGLAQLKGDWLARAELALTRDTRGVDPSTVQWYERIPPPSLSEIGDSSEIAKTADVVVFPIQSAYFPALGHPAGEGRRGETAPAVLSVAKNRNGPLGFADALWDRRCGCYRPLVTSASFR